MLLAMVLGCAIVTKQTDFDVDLPLIEGGSGDAISPGELPLDLKLYSSRPDWRMPTFLEVEDWGAIWLADSAIRADGGDGLLAVDVRTLTLDADPGFIDISFTPSSRDGRRFTLGEPSAAPELPEACTVRVDETTQPDDFGSDLRACLEAWSDAHGAPVTLHLDALVVNTDLDQYAFAADLSLGTSRPVQTFCSDLLVVDDELLAEADNVDIENLSLGGYAAAVDQPMDFVAFQNTFADLESDPLAGGHVVAAVDAKLGTYLGEEIPLAGVLPPGVSVSGVAPIAYFPDQAAWLSESAAALETPEGFVQACWVAASPAEPNEVVVHVTLVGVGHYDGREK